MTSPIRLFRLSIFLSCILFSTIAKQSLAETPSDVSAESLRPPASVLIDCKEAPKQAVTALPEKLSSWATIYCTKFGHILAYRDGYFGIYPKTGRRATINAARLSAKPGPVAHDAYFSHISYRPISLLQRKKLQSENADFTLSLDRSTPIYVLRVTVNTGHSRNFVVINPEKEPFWVFPLRKDKIEPAGFYIVTLEYVRKIKKN